MELKHLPQYLKENHIKIYYFGLGFIQVDTNKGERYHFYTTKLKGNNVESIHTHRYSFYSTVLKGCLIQDYWKEINHTLLYTKTFNNCGCPTEVVPPEYTKVGLQLLSSVKMSSGSEYFIHKDTIHSVNFEEDTITVVDRILGDKEAHAAVYNKDGDDIVCPFMKIKDEQLWNIIEEMCNV